MILSLKKKFHVHFYFSVFFSSSSQKPISHAAWDYLRKTTYKLGKTMKEKFFFSLLALLLLLVVLQRFDYII